MNDKVELLAREGINPFDQHDGVEPPSYEFGNGSRSNDFPPYRQQPQTTPSNAPTIPQSSAIQYPMAFFVAPPQPASGEQQPNVAFLQSSSVLRNQTQQAKRRSFLLPMLISCFVVWFCGFAFGIIAFVLASELLMLILLNYLFEKKTVLIYIDVANVQKVLHNFL